MGECTDKDFLLIGQVWRKDRLTLYIQILALLHLTCQLKGR